MLPHKIDGRKCYSANGRRCRIAHSPTTCQQSPMSPSTLLLLQECLTVAGVRMLCTIRSGGNGIYCDVSRNNLDGGAIFWLILMGHLRKGLLSASINPTLKNACILMLQVPLPCHQVGRLPLR